MIRTRNESIPPFTLDLKRLKRLGLFFMILIGCILLRASYYQVMKREPWYSMGPSQYQRRVKLMAKRGIISDRTGRALAMDIPIYALAVDPTQVKDPQAMAERLADVLGGNRSEYASLVSGKGKSRFVYLEREITLSQRDSLFSKKLPGLIQVKDRKRVYPLGDLAISVLGMTNGENEGIAGVELAANEELRGRDGWAIHQVDANRFNFPSPDYPDEPSRNGKNVTLTLDHVYQAILEEEIRTGIHQCRAAAGLGVLMDPFSGEILAMTSLLGDTRQDDILEKMKNRCVQEAFEPGSTLKIVTVAAALQEGIVTPKSLIYCENGSYAISAAHTIHDHDKGHAFLTLSQVFEVSSNIGACKVGCSLKKERLYRYIRDFGFGTATAIGLPQEAPGVLPPPYEWTDFTTAMASFGQGLSVTTLQLAAMVSAVANGGTLFKPVLIKKIQDEAGEQMSVFSGEALRRVISEETAAALTDMMEGVVLRGSGEKAAVQGLRVAGKTGTAQKSIADIRGYAPGMYVSSFVGFWPVETPSYVLAIVIEEPRYSQYGGQSAAPVFSRIVSRIAGLPPDMREKEFRPQKERHYALSSLPEEEEPRSMTVPAVSQRARSPYHLPDMKGLSVREAMGLLAQYNIKAQVAGNGVVILQQPAAGTRLTEGMICQLTCVERVK